MKKFVVAHHRRSARIAAMAVHVIGMLLMTGVVVTRAKASPTRPRHGRKACAGDNGGITLPPGFLRDGCSPTISVTRAHLVVAPNGVVYVNTWSGRYYGNDKPPAGGFSWSLCRIPRAMGEPTSRFRFGAGRRERQRRRYGLSRSTTARCFAEVNDRIVRYALPAGAIAPTGAPEVVVSGAAAHRRSSHAPL